MLRDGFEFCPLHLTVLIATDRLPVVPVIQGYIELVVRHPLNATFIAGSHIIINEFTNFGCLNFAILSNQDFRIPIY